jgi:Domain of unknown function (DUF932)
MLSTSINQIDLSAFTSINQTAPAETVSSKYAFIPTTQALAVLADYGWFPTQANEAKTRKAEHKGFQRHAIRLINEKMNLELMTSDVLPQLLLRNSHAGTSSFILTEALHVMMCSNGLVKASGIQDEIRVRHIGYTDGLMEAAVRQITTGIPETLEQTDRFKRLMLTEGEREAYAKAAIELRFDGEKYAVEPQQMLYTHRKAERDPNLWNTFNVVQEKVIRGGVRQRRADGSRIKSRRVQNIQEDIRLNKALWVLTEQMAKLKEAQ